MWEQSQRRSVQAALYARRANAEDSQVSSTAAGLSWAIVHMHVYHDST